MKSHSRVSHCPYRNLDAELKTGNIIQMQKTLLKTPTGSISKNKQEKVSVSKLKEKKCTNSKNLNEGLTNIINSIYTFGSSL